MRYNFQYRKRSEYAFTNSHFHCHHLEAIISNEHRICLSG